MHHCVENNQTFAKEGASLFVWRKTPPLHTTAPFGVSAYAAFVKKSFKNSSGDEIANVNFLTTISHTRRPTSKYRKRDKPTSFNKLDDR